jgi:hypothetical protein
VVIENLAILCYSNVMMEKARNIAFSTAIASGLTISPAGAGEELPTYENSHLLVVESEPAVGLNDDNDIEFSNIPAQPAQNIQLSNDFDGALTAQGFTVYLNEAQLEAGLEPNEAITIEQTEVVNTLYGLMQFTARNTVDTFESHQIRGDFIVDELSEKNNYSDYSLGNAGHYTNDQISEDFIALGDGLDAHATQPAELTLTHYSYNDNGSFEVLSEETATAEIVPNIQCEAKDLYTLPIQLTSEIIPTSEQENVMCHVAQTYQELLPPDFNVFFDASRGDIGIDSASDHDRTNNSSGGSLLLTYPYISGDEQVNPKSLAQIAMHEALHTTYFEADDETKQQLSEAHQLVDLAYDQQKIHEIEVTDLVWNCIRESTYHEPGSMVGHPWDNPTEMASSLATVMAYYPDQFLANFNKLDQDSQIAIAAAIRATERLISSRTDVNSIIPDYARVLATVESAI